MFVHFTWILIKYLFYEQRKGWWRRTNKYLLWKYNPKKTHNLLLACFMPNILLPEFISGCLLLLRPAKLWVLFFIRANFHNLLIDTHNILASCQNLLPPLLQELILGCLLLLPWRFGSWWHVKLYLYISRFYTFSWY